MNALGSRGRQWSTIALALAVALTIALVVGSVAESSAAGPQAVAAKKKCKKKGKKSAAAAKKKKCKKKKKKNATPPTPVVTPPKGPIERIVISWTGASDLDVHAWSNGLHDGWNETIGLDGDYEVQIPGTTYESSETLDNRERIVETNPNPSVPMTFGICNYPFVADPEETDVTVTWVLANGTTQTDEFPLDFGDFIVDGDQQGGPPDPVDEWCPEAP